MSKVEFIYSNGGKRVPMALRYAEALRKLGHGTYETRMLTAIRTKAPEEPRISDAVAAFAEEQGIDIETVTGTGKDGRINKSDIEAVIKAQDLV